MFAWPVLRPWIVWISAALFLMGLFLLFAYDIGWPTTRDSCIGEDQCYCEWFDVALVDRGAEGTRQPVNTWSNLYVFLTIPFIAFMISRDRYRGNPINQMQAVGIFPEVYAVVALFLGLGSMWFHASIAKHVSWMDGMSMYVFAGFLVFYTLDRIFVANMVSRAVRMVFFIVAYPLVVIWFTRFGARGTNSEILIGILVATYVLLELLPRNVRFWQSGWSWWPMNFIWLRDGWAALFWWVGLGCFGFATLARALSAKEGAPWCDPNSAFQPHGLLWHTFCGVMAVMLYLYWRRENVADRPATTAAAAPSTERWT
ncbi:hypothetical protein [Sphingomonas sp. DT-204]|uniref:hypothetical protein n=1 Tax=Sphingomonas sp. DT-204 TaxID=3396166 RepID=UPI003F1AF0DC